MDLPAASFIFTRYAEMPMTDLIARLNISSKFFRNIINHTGFDEDCKGLLRVI